MAAKRCCSSQRNVLVPAPVTLSLTWGEVNLERRRPGGGSLLKKEYGIEWGNKRLRVANDSREGDAGSQVIIHYQEIHLLPALFLFFSIFLPRPLFVSNWFEKSYCRTFLTSQQKLILRAFFFFCLPTQLLPRRPGFNIPLLCMRVCLNRLFPVEMNKSRQESRWQGDGENKVESQMRSRCAGNQFHGVWFCKAACWRRLS